jgi:tetratricopeptide (TPR) repeat protein
LFWYYEMQSGFSEAEAACLRAMAALTDDPRVDPVLLPILRSYHGYYLGRLGRLDYARAELERGCAELRQADARAESALPLIMLGTVAWQAGDYAGARPLLEESLRISRTMGNMFCTALALFFLGVVAHASGDYGQADESFREALRLAQIHGQPRLISMTSVLSGPTLFALGQYTEARERLQEGLALARASRIRWLVGVAQGHLGLVLNAQGDYAGARTALLEAVALAQESGNQWDRAWAEVGLGDAELGLGNPVQASNLYRLGLQLATEEHALPITLDALAGLALLRAQAGDQESALELAGHVLLHPASSGNARTRADQVCRMLNADSPGQPIGVAGTFEEIVQRILVSVS